MSPEASNSADALVTCNVENAVAVVTLNRPKAMNAMSKALRLEFTALLDDLSARDDVRAIVLTGAGEKAFTAGLDLKELESDPTALSGAVTPQDPANPVDAITRCSKPVIAAVNGYAITGGFEVVLACDIVLASENAKFADTHARVNVVPGWGLTQRLARIVGPSRAKEMHLACGTIDAETACAWGIANRVYAPDDLLPEAIKLGEAIAANDPGIVGTIRGLVDDGLGTTLDTALKLEAKASVAWSREAKVSGTIPDRNQR